MQSTEASTNGDRDSDRTTSDGSWPESIPSSPSSTRDQIDGSHWLPVIEEGSHEIHTSDSEPTTHFASAGQVHTWDKVSIVSLRAGKPLPNLRRRERINQEPSSLTASSLVDADRYVHPCQTELIDSSVPSGSNSDKSADSMMNRGRPIPRRALWEHGYFCDGNRYTQNGAKRVSDHQKSENDNQASRKEGTASHARSSDHQRSAQPVTLTEPSPTLSGKSSSGKSFFSCTEYASPQEEATTDPVLCTSTPSARRRAEQWAEELAAINARVAERMELATAAYASSLANASARTAPTETNVSPQEQFLPSASSDKSCHQHTESLSRPSRKSSICSRSMVWGKTMLTKAMGRRVKDGDAVEQSLDSASNRTQSRTASRSRTLANLAGLSSVRQFAWSRWHNRGRHRPTILTRTYNA